MSDHTFNYSVATDFGGQFNAEKFDAEIRSSEVSIALRGVSVAGDVVSVIFKSNLPTDDSTLMATLIAAHDGSPSEVAPMPVTLPGFNNVDGRLEVASYPSAADRVNLVTHRWEDKTTWYTMSAEVLDEHPVPYNPDGKTLYNSATDTWTGKKFKLPHDYIIDVTHGKLFMENYIFDMTQKTYRVVVTVNGEERREVDPDTENGEWSLDYETGMITMNPNIAESDELCVTYHYATTSEFFLRPLPHKILELRSVEVQFTSDISLKDTMVFQTFGYVGAFAPQLIGSPKDAQGGVFGPTDLIPLKEPVEYKTLFDYANESNGVYPVIPGTANNHPTWRDSRNDIITFPWNYQSVIPLYGTAGMFVQISLQNHVPFDGEFSTATFYCYSKDDPNAG